jgi:hypothetical protein
MIPPTSPTRAPGTAAERTPPPLRSPALAPTDLNPIEPGSSAAAKINQFHFHLNKHHFTNA